LVIDRSIDDDDAMVRPPCCDKEGVKKGPWTPEEDLVLVSYIQEHGPGNWRAVPTRTGMCLGCPPHPLLTGATENLLVVV